MPHTVGELKTLLADMDDDAVIIIPDADSGGYEFTWHVGAEVEKGNVEDERFVMGFSTNYQTMAKVFPKFVVMSGSGTELWDVLREKRERG